MIALLIAAGVTSAILLAAFAHILGVLVGQRKGFEQGFRLANDLHDDDEDDDFERMFGGLIDAGRRGEN